VSAADDTLARVIESFGRRAIVRSADGATAAAELFGKRISVVCGDNVRMQPSGHGDAPRIVEVLPRRTLLARTDSRGRTEELAANVDALLVLMAPEPASDPYIVDRYLAGAAYASLNCAIVINKSDLPLPESLSVAVAEYRSAGYEILEASARTGAGVDAIKQVIGNRVAMFVGQSGVGKSTLTNALVPASLQRTRELSESTGEGRHTTVSSVMFSTDSGGELIDSPGVRDYAPTPIADASVQVGWPEILSIAPECRFNDCLHLREPGCAVSAAVAAGTVARRRYESYKRLLNLMRGLMPSYERK
jgi:ribosome biogenesis GTPase / thiamine phosphate phosphatase